MVKGGQMNARSFLGFALSVLLMACGNGRNCNVAGDQAGSFMAKASSFPITLTMDSNWSAEEQAALRAAAETWNQVARRSGKPELFRVGAGTVVDLSGQSAIQGCELPEGSETQFPVVKISGPKLWNSMGFTDSTPAVTLRCHRGEELTKQAVLVNADLITHEQLRSVFLHELGHSLGLDHSCQLDADSSSFRGCSGLPDAHPYREAVMYPALRIAVPLSTKLWGNPYSRASYDPATLELKEILQNNDVERVSCLLNE